VVYYLGVVSALLDTDSPDNTASKQGQPNAIDLVSYSTTNDQDLAAHYILQPGRYRVARPDGGSSQTALGTTPVALQWADSNPT